MSVDNLAPSFSASSFMEVICFTDDAITSGFGLTGSVVAALRSLHKLTENNRVAHWP